MPPKKPPVKAKSATRAAPPKTARRVPARPAPKTKAKAKAKAKAATRVVAPKPRGKPAPALTLQSIVTDALADMKALDIRVIDVRGITDIADTMVIASGTSDRHVRSVAQRVVEKTKAAGFRPHGVEGQQDSDWVLIDLSDLIVHVMLPRVREFYGLEKLWDLTASRRTAGVEP